MNAHRAVTSARELVVKATELYYGDGPAVIGGGATLVGDLRVDEGAAGMLVGLTPVGARSAGLKVSRPVLSLDDDIAIEFLMGRAVVQAMRGQIEERIGVPGIERAPAEVLADLAAAHLLSQIGRSWGRILATLRSWHQSGIFSPVWRGDAPPGDHRLRYLESFFALLAAGRSFDYAALAVTLSMMRRSA